MKSQYPLANPRAFPDKAEEIIVAQAGRWIRGLTRFDLLASVSQARRGMWLVVEYLLSPMTALDLQCEVEVLCVLMDV